MAKNFLRNFVAKKKTTFLVVFFFIFFGLGLPSQTTGADMLSFLGNQVANAVASLVTYTILAIGAGFVRLSLYLLNNIVLSGKVITWSYTQLSNPLINVGWTLTRDLTNMLFVIVLVIIGLGTALKLKDYEGQKLLPNLIGIALLINFTPVILGVMVDAANIVMNFFLSGLGGFDVFGRVLATQQAILAQTLKGGDLLSFVVQVQVLTGCSIITSVILLAFSALFAVRYVAIWILVILSPFAFACQILPQTKDTWKDWWNHFIQWCFIGPAAAFFLYLGNYMMMEAPRMAFVSPPVSEGLAQPFVNMITAIMPYSISLIFLIFGLFTALTSSESIAKNIIQGAQKTVKGLPKWVATRRPVAEKLGAGAEAAASTVGAIDRGLAKVGGIKIPGTGITPLKPLLAPLGLATWAMRKTVVPAALKYAASTRKYEPPKGFDEWTPNDQALHTETLSTAQAKLQQRAHMAEKGNLRKTNKDYQQKVIDESSGFIGNPYFKKETDQVFNVLPHRVTGDIYRELRLAGKSGRDRKEEAEKMDKEISTTVDELKEKGVDEQLAGQYAPTVLHMRGLDSGDIKNMAKEAIETPEFRLAAQKMSLDHWRHITETFGYDAGQKILDEKYGLNTVIKNKVKSSDDLKRLHNENPALWKWFFTQQAGSIYRIDGEEYMVPKEFKEFREKALEMQKQQPAAQQPAAGQPAAQQPPTTIPYAPTAKERLRKIKAYKGPGIEPPSVPGGPGVYKGPGTEPEPPEPPQGPGIYKGPSV